MFNALKTRLFVAGIMAELKAQCRDQQFTNRIFELDSVVVCIQKLKDAPEYRNDKRRNFIGTALALSTAMVDESVDIVDRQLCYRYLADRVARIANNLAFYDAHRDLIDGWIANMDEFSESHQ